MDGSSSDNTLDILRSYSGRVKWVSERTRARRMRSIRACTWPAGTSWLISMPTICFYREHLKKFPGYSWKILKRCGLPADAGIITKTAGTRKPITAYKISGCACITPACFSSRIIFRSRQRSGGPACSVSWVISMRACTTPWIMNIF